MSGDFSLPTTAMLTPMANLLFKFYCSNICPRQGNRSLMTYQDLIIVTLLLKGHKFDLPGLILKNMMSIVNQKKTGLPYGLLLNKIFKYLGVKLDDRDKVFASEFFDVVSMTQSSIRVNHDDSLERIPQLMAYVQQPLMSSSSQPDTSYVDHYVDVLIDIKMAYAELKASLAGIQQEVQDLKADMQVLKSETQSLRSFCLSLFSRKMSRRWILLPHLLSKMLKSLMTRLLETKKDPFLMIKGKNYFKSI